MNIQELRDRDLIVLEVIVGSQAYGTATETSDVDRKGVFIQPMEDILSFGYVEQVSDESHDTTFYEIRRFLELLSINNPNVLELLHSPEECVIHMDPIFQMVIDNADKFITKACQASFGNYAIQQIKKARGLNKKIVNPHSKVRKGVLDFCYVQHGQGSIPVKEHLEKINTKQEDCGLVAIPHMRYTYAAHVNPDSKYKGIVQDPEKSNDISLSSVEKGSEPLFVLCFNKDGYSTSCREYREYLEWEEKRNVARYSDNMLHGKGYDGKNCAHAMRLLQMAIEIGKGEGINVRRSNREELLSIRRGERDYEDLLTSIEKLKDEMNLAFDNSTLPDRVDEKFVKELLLAIRLRRYKI